MKNRRIVVVAIMLAAVLCVGVGYAAVTDTINATGTITYNPEIALQWTGDVSGEGSVITETTNGDTLKFTVDTSTWEKNVPHTFTVTVSNTSAKYGATGVAVSTVTNNASGKYTVAAEIGSDTIPARATATVTITITLTDYPTVDKYSQTFEFTVSNTGVSAAS